MIEFKVLYVTVALCVISTQASDDTTTKVPCKGEKCIQKHFLFGNGGFGASHSSGIFHPGGANQAAGGYYPGGGYYQGTHQYGGHYPAQGVEQYPGGGYYPGTGLYPLQGQYPLGGYYPGAGQRPFPGQYPGEGYYPQYPMAPGYYSGNRPVSVVFYSAQDKKKATMSDGKQELFDTTKKADNH